MVGEKDPFETIDSLSAPAPRLPTNEQSASNRPRADAHQSETNQSASTDPASTIACGVGDRTSSSKRPSTNDRQAGGAGRYDRVAELGRGGWGVVDRVVDKQLEREVAVKRIGGDGKLGTSKLHNELRQRFLHEAKVTSQLQHPGVVPVHEFGTGDNGESFYVMKLLEGDTLRQLIRTHHAPARAKDHRWTAHSLKTAIAPLLERFIHVCNAVAYAHEKGIIHRDLKPANVMAGAFGETIVVDWGLVKRFGSLSVQGPQRDKSEVNRSPIEIERDTDAAMRECDFFQRKERGGSDSAQHTTQGSIIGTPAYMSPEQASGLVDQLGPAADIYSLGVILYEIVAGRHPYHGLELTTILENIKAGKYPLVTSIQPIASKSLAAICHTAMAFEPRDRYSSATALADDVRRFIAGDAVSVYAEPFLDRMARLCRRYQSSCIAAAISALVLLIASVGFGAVIHRAHQSEKSARTTAQIAHREAVVSLSDARDAADAWLVELSGSLESYPGMKSLREKLITNAMVQYEKIISDLASDIEQWSGQGYSGMDDISNIEMAKLEQAKCQIRLGDLYRMASQMPPISIAVDAPDNHPSATKAAAANAHYASAGKILEDLIITLKPIDHARGLLDACRLQQVNVLIGQQLMFLTKLSTNPGPQSQAIEAFQSHREWLLSQLSSHSLQSQEQYSYAFTLVRYELATYRAHHSQLPSEDVLGNLQEAVQWSKWLANKRGQSTDQALSEAAQRELATKQEADALTDQAAGTWLGLANDLELWTNVDEPRPDRLQALAYARMRHAHLSTTLLQSDVAIESYRLAIDDLSHAWNLLDSDSFYRTNLATAQHNLGKLIATHSSEPSEAAHWLRQSITNYQTLLKSEMTADTIRRLCEANGSLAKLLSRDRREDAMNYFDDAVLGYQMLADHQMLCDEDRIQWCEILMARSTNQRLLHHIELANQDMAAAAMQLAKLNPEKLSASHLASFNRAKALLLTASPALSEAP